MADSLVVLFLFGIDDINNNFLVSKAVIVKELTATTEFSTIHHQLLMLQQLTLNIQLKKTKNTAVVGKLRQTKFLN